MTGHKCDFEGERGAVCESPQRCPAVRASARWQLRRPPRLTCLIEAYERSRSPRGRPTPPDLLTYLMEQHGLSRADLVPLVGTASRVSEVWAMPKTD